MIISTALRTSLHPTNKFYMESLILGVKIEKKRNES